MLWTLIKKEFVGHVLSLRFIATFALLFALLFISAVFMVADYSAALDAYHFERSAQREKAEELIESGRDGRLFFVGLADQRPPRPLRIFATGLEREVPIRVNVAGMIQRTVNDDIYLNPVRALFATPDYAYIVGVVGSLLGLLFVFDAICGEKERGTLKQVLANSVPRDKVLLGKCLGGYMALALPFLVASLAGAACVHLSGTIVLEGERLWRLVWIVVGALVYLLLFFNLGMLISAATHRNATALIASLLVWICWVFIVPHAAPVLARALVPVPSLQKLEAEKKAIYRETGLQAHRVEDPVLSQKIREEGEHRQRKLERYYQDRLQYQIELSKILARLSPTASFVLITSELAGTGTGFFTRFNQAYERFRAETVDFLPNGYDPNAKKVKIEELPRLELVSAPLEESLATISVDLLLLGLFNVLFFLLTYMLFLRYDAT